MAHGFQFVSEGGDCLSPAVLLSGKWSRQLLLICVEVMTTVDLAHASTYEDPSCYLTTQLLCFVPSSIGSLLCTTGVMPG